MWVKLHQRDTTLELIIRDDGAGFDVAAARRRAARGASLGLLGMEERVLLVRGKLKIKSGVGAGTEIRARFPLSSAAEGKARGQPTKPRRTK